MDNHKVVSNQYFEPSQKWKAYNKKSLTQVKEPH